MIKSFLSSIFFMVALSKGIAQSTSQYAITFAGGVCFNTIETKGIRTLPAYSFGVQLHTENFFGNVNIDILPTHKLQEPHLRKWADGYTKTFEYMSAFSLNAIIGYPLWKKDNWQFSPYVKAGLEGHGFTNKNEAKQPNSGRLGILFAGGCRFQYNVGRYGFVGIQTDANLSPHIGLLNGDIPPFNEMTYFTTKLVLGIYFF